MKYRSFRSHVTKTWWLFLVHRSGGYSIKFYTGRLRPEVQTLTTIVKEKRKYIYYIEEVPEGIKRELGFAYFSTGTGIWRLGLGKK